MDRVRFGRALGYGARHAAKALVQAADAASADTSRVTHAPSKVSRGPASSTPPKDSERPTPIRQRENAANRSRTSVFHPLKRYSGTVFLQVVGTFFALFAALMAQNAWKLRSGIHQPWKNPEAQHLWMLSGLFCLFSWFAVSSFLRARRLERS